MRSLVLAVLVLSALIPPALGSAPAEPHPTPGIVRQTIEGYVHFTEVAVASDGANFVVVWSDASDRLLRTMVIGSRGNVVSAPRALPTGLRHTQPAVAWTGTDYVLVSIDMQPPRRLILHRLDARGQLTTPTPAFLATELLGTETGEYADVMVAAGPSGVWIWWIAVGYESGPLYGYGPVLMKLDATASAARRVGRAEHVGSMALDGSNLVYGFAWPVCGPPHCFPEANGTLQQIHESFLSWSPLAHGIEETSVSSSPLGVFYVKDGGSGRRGYVRSGGVAQEAEGPGFPIQDERSASIGSEFLVAWAEPRTCVGSSCAPAQIVGSYVTPRPGQRPVATSHFVIERLPAKLLAIAGTNRGAGLLLIHNELDDRVEWIVLQAPARPRGVRR